MILLQLTFKPNEYCIMHTVIVPAYFFFFYISNFVLPAGSCGKSSEDSIKILIDVIVQHFDLI